MMKPIEPGILSGSDLLLYDASEQAKGMYYYALCVGHYYVGEDYIVRRQNYDSFLLIYVRQGRLFCRDRNQRRREVPQGSFALVDCFEPHEYGALAQSEIYWIHFNGPVARQTCDVIRQVDPLVPRSLERSTQTIVDIYERTRQNGVVAEAIMNRLIVTLLTEFLVSAEEQTAGANETIEEIRNYILEHPYQNLPLEELARQANLSTYHFSRLFKRQVGSSPHDFLINARLALAKFYLLTTDRTVKQIAFSCGFSSECAFCTSFRKRLDMTPTEFRAANTRPSA